MNWLKEKAARWLLGKAIVVAQEDSEQAIAAIPQSKRTTVIGILYFCAAILRIAIPLFDGDPSTHASFDMLDVLLFGGGYHAIVTREQKAHDEEVRLTKK